ncbi:MAG: DUF853 family protein [Bacillota bacterium]|nr:DUF853 family protein [Bacillota bacterium]
MSKLILGHSSSRESLTWENAANSHIFVSGCSGMGKSYFIRKLVHQLPAEGVHCIILDASNDWSGLANSHVYSKSMDSTIDYIDVKSREFSINPLQKLILADDFTEDWNDVSFRLADTMKVAYKLRDIQAVYLMNSVYEFMHTSRYPKTIGGFLSYAELDMEKDRQKRIEISLARLKHLNRTIHCSESSFQWKLDSPGMTVLDFSKVIAEGQQALLVELILGELWSQRLGRVNGQNVPIVVVVDECQKFKFRSNSFLTKILREGRKYQVSGWFASQWISDPDTLSALEQAAFRAYFRPEAGNLHKLAVILSAGEKRKVARYEKALSKLGIGQYLYHTPSGHPVIANVGK